MARTDDVCLILAYHAIASQSSPVAVTPIQLEGDLARLQDAGFSFLTLDDYASGPRAGAAPRAAIVTFDDGYRSVLELAAPVLRRFDVRATVYAVAGRLGGDNRWPGQWRSIPSMPLLSSAELRALRDEGHAIGAHSWSHASLPALSLADLHREVVEAGDRLAALLGEPVRHFAYPYGHRGAREVAVAGTRYLTAVSSEPARVRSGVSLHDLPRIDPHDLRIALRLGLERPFAFDAYLGLRGALRRVRRRLSAP